MSDSLIAHSKIKSLTLGKQAMVGALGGWLISAFSLFGEHEHSSNAYHLVLEGTVGEGLAVRMVLEKRDSKLEGYYYDKENPVLLSLEGEQSDWGGTLKMSGQSGFIGGLKAESSGKWEGEFDAEGALVGTWSSPDGNRALPFKLVEVDEVGVLKVRPEHRTLHCVYSRDEHQGGEQWDLKYARFSPEQKGVGKINQWILSEVQNFMMSNVEDSPKKEKLIAGATDQSIEKSLRGMASERALEMAGFSPEIYSLKVHVVHNANGTLCLGIYRYVYEGGGHGASNSKYAVFDVSTGKRIELGEILKEGYENPLAEMGASILRKRAGVKQDAPFSEMGLFPGPLKLNGNWFVNVEGIGFSYNPYEIASYTRGFVAFTIPFEQLKPWLKDNTLVSRIASRGVSSLNQSDLMIEPNHTTQSTRYYNLASAALSNKQHYFDQRLDFISMKLYQKIFDEGIRTRMAGARDQAKLRFSAEPQLARKSISSVGAVPTRSAEMIELATWMVVAAKLDQLTEEQQLQVE